MHAGGGSANFTPSAFSYCFAMLDFSLPGGSAKCFKFALSSRCFSIVVLRLLCCNSFCNCRFAIVVLTCPARNCGWVETGRTDRADFLTLVDIRDEKNIATIPSDVHRSPFDQNINVNARSEITLCRY